MLKIRQEQKDAFLPKTDEERIDFIIEHLHEESPERIEDLSPDTLREMVANGIARARSHGLQSLYNLTAFVSIMFEIAPNFDDEPELRQVLRDDNVSVDERFDKLFEPEHDEAWTRAGKYDGDAWMRAWFPDMYKEEEQ